MERMVLARSRQDLERVDHDALTRVISLGAGVQSSTLALMAAHGEFEEMPDAAVFADTGAEPEAVYRWLWWLAPRLPFPTYIVNNGDIREDTYAALEGARFATAPFYTESEREGGGRLRRQCTKEYKLVPIKRKIRDLVGLEHGQRSKGIVVEQWMGISLDEAHRMSPPREAWTMSRYPLIERRMSRDDCKRWMAEHGYPEPPESSCVFCPFHSNAKWARIKRSDPKAWQSAVEMDRAVRGGVCSTKERLYVHRSLQPLEEVDLSRPEDHGQTDMFGEDCEGYCGV